MFLVLAALLAAASSPAASRDTVARGLADPLAVARDSVSADSMVAIEAGPVLAGPGDQRGQVIEPAGVAVDPFGRIVVSDAALHRVQRFDRDGRWLGENGVLGSDAGELRRPGSVAVLGALGTAVLDRENRRIESFDLFGRRLGTALDLADPGIEGVTGRVDPTAFASDRGGALYVADPTRERVLAFDASGRFLRSLGGYGERPGQFRGLRGLATAPNGELVTSERQGARIQRLDASGRVVASWPVPLSDHKAGALPLAVDGEGRVAVADEASGTLWLFDARGRRIGVRTGLGAPRALAFAPDGSLVVAEARPAQVRRYRLTSAAP